MTTVRNQSSDSFCYICSKHELELSLKTADGLLQSIMSATNSSHYYMFLSPSGNYYRHSVNEEYKGNRPPSPLLFLKEVKQHLVDKHKGLIFDGLEADDLMGFANMNVKWDSGNVITCAIDKDVKKTIPGPWFDYKKREWGETTLEDASFFAHVQAIAGDSGDNIKGLPGIGPAKGSKILNAAGEGTYIEKVFKAYLEHHNYRIGPAVYDFQKNFRQVYILRSKQDFINEVGYVPELPEPINY